MRSTFPSIARAFARVLAWAAAHAEARKIAPAALLSSRRYPNMYPFTKQVQSASDSSKGAAARLADIDSPVYADTEATFPELQQRLQKTIDGAEARDIKLVFPSLTLKYTGLDYLLKFAQPNFYFHVTMAHAILRHNGMEIGKADFLGL